MKWNLIRFKSTDGIELSGILSCPDNPKSTLLYIHGLTSSFQSEYPILEKLQKQLFPLGVGVMAFNNRGYGIVNRFKKEDKNKKEGYRSVIIGGAFEKFEDCQYDIEGATRYITENMLCDVILCGISTGCNKSVYYLSKSVKSPVSGLILLSAVSDIEAFGENPQVLKRLRENAQKLIELGKPNQLLEKVDDEFPLSAQRMASLVNTEASENTFPYIDLKPKFKLFKKIDKPVLLIYGENDEYMRFDKQKAIQVFKSQSSKAYSISSEIIRGAGHGFDGFEISLSRLISRWIKNKLN